MATLNEIMRHISILNDSSNSIPATTDEIYSMRVNLINGKLEWLFDYRDWEHTEEEFTALVNGTDETPFPALLVAKLVLPEVKISEGADSEEVGFLSQLKQDADGDLRDFINKVSKKYRTFKSVAWSE